MAKLDENDQSLVLAKDKAASAEERALAAEARASAAEKNASEARQECSAQERVLAEVASRLEELKNLHLVLKKDLEGKTNRANQLEKALGEEKKAREEECRAYQESITRAREETRDSAYREVVRSEDFFNDLTCVLAPNYRRGFTDAAKLPVGEASKHASFDEDAEDLTRVLTTAWRKGRRPQILFEGMLKKAQEEAKEEEEEQSPGVEESGPNEELANNPPEAPPAGSSDP